MRRAGCLLHHQNLYADPSTSPGRLQNRRRCVAGRGSCWPRSSPDRGARDRCSGRTKVGLAWAGLQSRAVLTIYPTGPTSLHPASTEPSSAAFAPGAFLPPSPSSVGRGPSPTLHDSPLKSSATTPQADFLSSLTHLAYPSPASSTPTPPATSNLDEYIISAPAPASIEVEVPSEPIVSFEEDMLVWPTDLSTFSRPSSPNGGLKALKTEEVDLTVLSVVKREDESSLWTIEGTSSWTW